MGKMKGKEPHGTQPSLCGFPVCPQSPTKGCPFAFPGPDPPTPPGWTRGLAQAAALSTSSHSLLLTPSLL